jgi:hypothetical protein
MSATTENCVNLVKRRLLSSGLRDKMEKKEFDGIPEGESLAVTETNIT